MGGASTLEGLTWLVAALALLTTLGGAWRAREAIDAAHGGLRTAAPGVLLLAGPAAWLLLGTAPHAPWHSYFHGLERAAWLRDHAWWQDAGSGNLHGPGWYLWVRLLTVPSAGLLSPFAANALLAGFGSLALFLLVDVVSRNRTAAAATAILHLALPFRLRVASTLSLYVGVELTLLVAAWLTAVHVRDRTTRTLVPAVAAAVLAAHTHLELLPATPLACVGVALATEAGGLRDPARRRRALLAVGAAALACLPLVLTVVLASPGHLPGAPGTDDALQAAMRTRALIAAAVLVGLALAAPSPRGAPRGVAVLLVAVSLLVAWSGGAPEAPPGAIGPVGPWGRVHAWWSPLATPAPWPLLGLAGLGLAWFTDRASFRASAAGLAALAYFHAGTWDVASTYVRVALPASGFLLWPAGVLLAAALGRVAPLAAALLAAAGLVTHGPWLRWTYPSQHEYALLVEARQLALDEDLPVVVPGPLDAPAGVDPTRFDLAYHRAYLRQMLGPGVRALSLAEATATPPAAALYVRSLQCVRPLVELAAPGAPADLLVAGRVWRADHDGMDLLTAVSPCWSRPELASCVEEAPDGTCALWSCPRGQGEGAPPSAYLDPLCAAFEAGEDLQPLREVTVEGPSLFGDAWPQGTRIGLYRAAPHGGGGR